AEPAAARLLLRGQRRLPAGRARRRLEVRAQRHPRTRRALLPALRSRREDEPGRAPSRPLPRAAPARRRLAASPGGAAGRASRDPPDGGGTGPAGRTAQLVKEVAMTTTALVLGLALFGQAEIPGCGDPPPRASSAYWDYIAACGCAKADPPSRASL